jgi:hypothetical protein
LLRAQLLPLLLRELPCIRLRGGWLCVGRVCDLLLLLERTTLFQLLPHHSEHRFMRVHFCCCFALACRACYGLKMSNVAAHLDSYAMKKEI